jgi:hypothetical protein
MVKKVGSTAINIVGCQFSSQFSQDGSQRFKIQLFESRLFELRLCKLQLFKSRLLEL